MTRALGEIDRSKDRSPLPSWARALLVGGTFLALIFLEWRNPLRRRVESKFRHMARNLAMAGLGSATMQLTELPAVRHLSRLAVRFQ
jgi:hypothetical protein